MKTDTPPLPHPKKSSTSSLMICFSAFIFSYLFILFALFSKGVTLHLLQEADGNVVDLLLVEHGQSVRLPGALVRAASDEEGAILQRVGMDTVGLIVVTIRRI